MNFTDGFLLGGDSQRYIKGADTLLKLELPKGKGSSYLGYIFFISMFKFFNLNLTYVVIAQIFLTLLSSLCLYKITKKISSNYGGLLTLSLYLFYFPLQIRNFYILTETVFICSIIFLIYLIFFFKKKYLIIIVILVPFIVLTRPHGIILIPSLILSALICFYTSKKFKLFYISLIVIIIFFYSFLSLTNFYLENEQIMFKIINSGIIYGYNHEDNYLNFNKPLEVKNDIVSLLIFIKNNLYNFIISFYKKVWFFLIRVRPFYSDIHNIYLILFNIILYPLLIYGFIKIGLKNNFAIIFMYFFVIFSTISVGLTFADWSGRFVLYIFPIFFIFAGIGFSYILKLILKDNV
ncbi:glycosyltransferase family 39 protein [Candidatus Pelagibacter sp.]|nr:glycosyltransferase family 39 protein [Candidatus Pelagibacter sp.]